MRRKMKKIEKKQVIDEKIDRYLRRKEQRVNLELFTSNFDLSLENDMFYYQKKYYF